MKTRFVCTAWLALGLSLTLTLTNACGGPAGEDGSKPGDAESSNDEGADDDGDGSDTDPTPDPDPDPTPDPAPDPDPTPDPDPEPEPEPASAPSITFFRVDDGSAVVLNDAGPVTLSWSVTDADACAIAPFVGTVDANSGSRVVEVSAPTNFTLTCDNDAGAVSSSVSVAFELPAEILHFTVDGGDSAEVLSGGAVTLSWDTSNALSCAIEPTVGAVDSVGTRVTEIAADTTLTLTCQGPLGAVSASVDVTVYYPPAIASFASDVATLRAFVDEAELSWAVEHADACAITPAIGDVDPSSGQVLVSADAVDVTLSYTLTCTGRGGSDTATVHIDVPEVVHDGDFVLTAQNGSQLVGVNRITGTLQMQALFLSSVPFFDTVQHIEGELYVKNMAAMTSLSMPRLQTVGSHLTIRDNGVLQTLSLPALTTVGGYFTIDALKALSTLTMPSLSSVGGNLYLSRTPLLAVGVAQSIADGAQVGGDVLIFRNVLTEILSDIHQSFLCEVPAHWPSSGWRYQFQIHAGGTAYMFTPNASTGAFSTYETGTWMRNGDDLTVTMPSKGNMPATALSNELDAIISYTMNGKLCGTMGLGGGTGLSTTPHYECSGTEFEPGLYYVDDSFELFADSSVRWVRETNYTGNYSDTIWETRIGSYFLMGSRVYFAFPTLGANPWLTATRSGSQLTFDNLGSHSNSCSQQ